MKLTVAMLAGFVGILLTAVIVSNSVTAQTMPSTAELEGRVNSFNNIFWLSLSQWTSQYDTLREASANQWMDWSQDGCSVPGFAGLGQTEGFHMGCLRHDFMWRTLAVADEATGRVWNERNRYRADRKFLSDNQASCNDRFGFVGGENLLIYCHGAAGSYYGAVRHLAGYRHQLVGDEQASVTDPAHAEYHSAMKVADATNCNYSQNSSNRCLPIHYIKHNGKPFAPQNLATIPTNTAIELEVVRANLQAVSGSPSPDQPTLGIINPLDYRKTGSLYMQADYPFAVSRSRTLSCPSGNSSSAMYVGSSGYPIPTAEKDWELKSHLFYLKACSSATASSLSTTKLYLKPVEAVKAVYGYSDRLTNNVRDYQNINAQAPNTWLSPRPDAITITSQDLWHSGFTLQSTDPLTQVKIVANPNDDTPLLEITTTATRSYCGNGAEKGDYLFLAVGSAMKVAMCGIGTGTLEIQNPANGEVLNSYVVEMAAPAPVPTTVVPTRIPACYTGSIITSIPATRTEMLSVQDCLSPYHIDRFVEYYQLRLSASQRIQIDMLANDNYMDPYLFVYSFATPTGVPGNVNDDVRPGILNSRITMDVTGGRTYLIGVSTWGARDTGAYTLQVSAVQATLPVPAIPTGLSSSSGNAIVSLDWNNASNASAYQVQQWDSSSSSWFLMPGRGFTITFNGSSAMVRGLTNGGTVLPSSPEHESRPLVRLVFLCIGQAHGRPNHPNRSHRDGLRQPNHQPDLERRSLRARIRGATVGRQHRILENASIPGDGFSRRLYGVVQWNPGHSGQSS